MVLHALDGPVLIPECEAHDDSSGVGIGSTGVTLEAGALDTKDVSGSEEGSVGAVVAGLVF